jgi:hypothetical protein
VVSKTLVRLPLLSKRRLALASIVFTCLVLLAGVSLEIHHRWAYGHFAPFRLHVDALSMQSRIGIPGQTHLYWAQLTNFRPWPVLFAACDYVTDVLAPGTEYAYGVQRWDDSSGSWMTISVPDAEWFCRPAPLSKMSADPTRHFIWPGQSVHVMDFEAVGARDEFRHGDLARFVVFRAATMSVDWSTAVPSESFRIEDNVVDTDSVPFRIRH